MNFYTRGRIRVLLHPNDYSTLSNKLLIGLILYSNEKNYELTLMRDSAEFILLHGRWNA